MQEAVPILMQTTLAFALAVAGGTVSAFIRLSHERLCGWISLAAGTLLGVTLFSILPESAATLPWWELLPALASGYVVFFLVSKYVYHVCPACAASHFDEATAHRFSEIATALIVALAVHSTMDGLALAAGQESEHGAGLGVSLLVAICVHKVPEGLALGALLIGAGFRPGAVIAWVTAVEATTVLGGGIGLMFFPAAHGLFWLAVVLAHAGGGFVYLAGHAVLGELVRHGKKLVLTSFIAGLVVIGALKLIVRSW